MRVLHHPRAPFRVAPQSYHLLRRGLAAAVWVRVGAVLRHGDTFNVTWFIDPEVPASGHAWLMWLRSSPPHPIRSRLLLPPSQPPVERESPRDATLSRAGNCSAVAPSRPRQVRLRAHSWTSHSSGQVPSVPQGWGEVTGDSEVTARTVSAPPDRRDRSYFGQFFGPARHGGEIELFISIRRPRSARQARRCVAASLAPLSA